MSIAAFLLMNERVIIQANRGMPGQKYIFEFKDDDEMCYKIALKFLSSKCSKYDGHLRMLRSMIRG